MPEPAVDVVDQVVPAPRPPSAGAGATIAELQRAGQVLHHALAMTVRALRLEGATWTAVGQHLGVSRQAAEKRWRYLDDSPIAIVREGGRAEFHCNVTGLVWDPRVEAVTTAAARALTTTTILPATA